MYNGDNSELEDTVREQGREEGKLMVINIIKLVNRGYSQEEISKMLNIDLNQVIDVLYELYN